MIGALSLGAGIAVAAAAPVAATPTVPAGLNWTSKVPICHATDSSHFNYNLQLNSTNVNKAVTEESGHGATGIDAWDIIPAFDYLDANGQAQHFDGLNWTSIEPHAAGPQDKKAPGIAPTGFTGQQIFENDCNAATASAAGGVRLTKVVADANGDPLPDQTDGNQFTFSAAVTQNNTGDTLALTQTTNGTATTVLSAAGGTASGTNASVSTDPFTLLQGPVTFTVTENAPADSPYRLAGITCTVNNQPLNPSFDPSSGGTSGTITFTPFIGQNVACTFVNQLPPTYSATLLKLDPAAGPLAGAQFELRNANGDALGTATTDSDGAASIGGLAAGTYTWVEIVPPNGYDLPATATTSFVLPGSGGDTTTTVPNFPVNSLPELFPVSVLKTDAETGDPLSGASFVLCTQDANPCDQADQFGSVVTDDGGLGELSVPAGTYYWVETAPPAGHDIVGGTFEVTAGADSAPEPVEVPNTQTDTLPPPPPVYSVALRKTDLATGENLNGVQFQLCQTVACDSGYVSDPVTTHHVEPDVEGFAEVTGLPAGAYYWVETARPAGYVPTAPVPVTVDESTGSVGTVIRNVARDDELIAQKSITAISGGGYQDTAGSWHFTAADETIDYSITVVNRGGQPVTSVRVEDDLAGLTPLTCALGINPGAAVPNGELDLGPYDNNSLAGFMNADGSNYAICTASYTVTAADIEAASVVNAAYATGVPSDDGPPLETPPSEATATAARLAFDKAATVIHAGVDTHATAYSAVGDVILYTFTVTNVGRDDVAQVTVNEPVGQRPGSADPLGFTGSAPAGFSPITCVVTGDEDEPVLNGQLTLASGQTAECTATYSITDADLDQGAVRNVASASGTVADGSQPVLTPIDDATVTGPTGRAAPESDPNPTPPAASPEPDAPTLASTGAAPAAQLAAGAGLVALGALLLLLGMRRRPGTGA